MFGSAALDVVIGLFFVYLILSLIASGLNEGVSSLFAMRAKVLEDGIRNLLGSKQAKEEFYEHSLVKSMTKETGVIRKIRKRLGGKDRRFPSYIPSRTFALALLDNITGPDAPITPASVKQALETMPESNLKKSLIVLWNDAGAELSEFQHSVERWFDEGMERVSGWYRRRVHVVLWAISLLMVIALNADTVVIAKTLWNDDTLRAAVVAEAETTVEAGQQAVADPEFEDVAAEFDKVQDLNLPIGWTLAEKGSGDAPYPQELPDTWGDLGELFPEKLLGLFLTAAALTLGAPFWFDLLGKVAGVRSSGGRPSGSRTRRGKDEPAEAVEEGGG